MKITLDILLPIELFDLQEAPLLEALARRRDSHVYTWKTSGRANWLELGPSIVDCLGLVVLPGGLPEVIDMPDDKPE